MRNTTCMNDFSEVRYGIELFSHFCQSDKYIMLKNAFGKQAKAFESAMSLAIQNFEAWAHKTYICCFSEHENEEDENGRLSMWRGYGNGGGVAIVLQSDSFISGNEFFDIYTSPVEYLSEEEFDTKMDELITRVTEGKEFLESMPDTEIVEWVTHMINYAVVSIKHPGFKEEKEWRVVADFNQCSNELRVESIVLNEIPQLILKLPLTDEMENNEKGFSINSNLDHLLIGPTPYPVVIRDALRFELKKCGVNDAEKRISVSRIPYRSRL